MAPIYDIPETALPFFQRARFLKGVILPALLIGAVLGVIYSGIATVTEAAAIGAVGALVVAGVRKELTWRMARDAMRQTVRQPAGPILFLDTAPAGDMSIASQAALAAADAHGIHADLDGDGRLSRLLLGEMVEAGSTDDIFTNPADPRTADYVAGRFG